MGRISSEYIEEYEKSDGSSSEWLKLSDNGDVARVQFLYDKYEDLETFACHKVKTGVSESGRDIERWVDCKRDYNDPIDMCPFCAAGIPVKPVTIVRMFDHKDNKVKIWERGKTFRKKLESLFNRYPKLSDMVFEIERNGAKGDKKTSYELYPMPDVEPLDVSDVEKPDFIGTVILDKTPEEMNYYLQYNAFPENNAPANNTNPQPSRRSLDRAPQQPQPRGGVTRRARVE